MVEPTKVIVQLTNLPYTWHDLVSGGQFILLFNILHDSATIEQVLFTWINSGCGTLYYEPVVLKVFMNDDLLLKFYGPNC